jgi:hypothetical protein
MFTITKSASVRTATLVLISCSAAIAFHQCYVKRTALVDTSSPQQAITSSYGRAIVGAATLDRELASRLDTAYRDLPLTFEQNQGQADARVKFYFEVSSLDALVGR